jgi:glutathione S-transferase
MSGIASPAMLYTAAVTILTVLLFFYMALTVGRMRAKHGIKAPSITGHEEFERALRVQMNTVEGAIAFLPALWIAAIWFGGWIPPVAGFVWFIGRVIYMLGYMAAPEKRSTGFTIQALALIVLIFLAVWGVVQTFMMI